MSVTPERFNSTEWDADVFKAWMRSMDMKNQDAAHQLGVHEKTISKYANGRADIPKSIVLACQMVALKYQMRQASLKKETEKAVLGEEGDMQSA